MSNSIINAPVVKDDFEPHLEAEAGHSFELLASSLYAFHSLCLLFRAFAFALTGARTSRGAQRLRFALPYSISHNGKPTSV